jgi:elongator complex protein 3
MPAKGDTADV